MSMYALQPVLLKPLLCSNCIISCLSLFDCAEPVYGIELKITVKKEALKKAVHIFFSNLQTCDLEPKFGNEITCAQ